MPAQSILLHPSHMVGVSLHRILKITPTLHTSPALVLLLLAGESRHKVGLQAQPGMQLACCINHLNTASQIKQLPPPLVKPTDLYSHTETAEGLLPQAARASLIPDPVTRNASLRVGLVEGSATSARAAIHLVGSPGKVDH